MYVYIGDDNSTKEVVKKAAQKVGSLKETEFDIRFNPDVFSPGVKHYNPESDQFKIEKQLVVDAAEYLLLSQIPLFVGLIYFLVNIFKQICLVEYYYYLP